MSGVEPLEKSQARRVSRTQADVDSTLSSRVQRIAHEQKMADEQALNKLHALVEEGSRFEVFDDGRQVEGRRRGVDGGLVRRMRNGELTPDATLDLLGLGLEQAKAAVQTFIRERRTKGDRVVVIRFRRGMGASSVLRGELVAWLSEGKTAFHIAAFLTSPPEFGGEDCLSALIAQPAERYRGMK
jgi:DNA-nicking Smr family endonuclease